MSLRGLDVLAPHYHWMERILAGGILQRSRLEFLKDLEPRRVLVAGEGHGKFLGAFLRVFPETRVTYVDASAGMLEVAKRHLGRQGISEARVTWVQAVLPEWKPPAGQFDLVVTNFFLDCFAADGLGAVVARLASGCEPQAAWIVTDFHVPPRGAARCRAKAVLWLMYRFFCLVTNLPARRLEDPSPWITVQGFVLATEKTWDWGLVRSQLWRRGL